jgi:3-phosphoshikimate 1-carboxyvinyltransferase
MPSLTAVTIRPARRLAGRLRVPGDKSISHRYALLGALAEGRTALSGYAPGADCRSTLTCLRRLGVEISEDTTAHTVALLGRGLGRLGSPGSALDCGNSGTTMRLLAGVLAGQAFASRMEGDASLSRRPMRRVIAPLERMGARIESTDGHAPLVIEGARLRAIAHTSDVPSAQIKSAVLLAGLHADGVTSVVEPFQTRDHTERALEAFGVTIARGASGVPTVSLAGGQRLTGRALSIPGDFSSAAFWMVAAAATPGSRVVLDDVGLNPTRTALVGVLERFGARVHVELTDPAGSGDSGNPGDHDAGEPRGTIIVEGDRTGGIAIAPAEVAALIDELPAIAALAARGGEVAVHGAAELRVKESDRIATLAAGFRALGFGAEERPDGFTIRGPAGAGGVADAQGDHRMAMAFAIAALAATGPSTIEGADAVGISYPEFFDTLDRLIA